ncbi:MAG: hypothetical protein WCX31_08795 [Salinivirgaceae bacterium]|jgi:Leucine-rich repeat (LRR) protein
MNKEKLFITVFGLSLILVISNSAFAQKPISESYYWNKKGPSKKPPIKQKEKVYYLAIDAYSDEFFPNDLILEFPNLETLQVSGVIRPGRSGISTNKFIKTIQIDTAKLNKLPKLKTLIIGGLAFTEFPIVLSNLTSLKKIELIYSNIDTIPDGIVNFIHVTEFNFACNRIVFVTPEISKLQGVQSIDLANNKLKNIPEGLLIRKYDRLNLGNNYGNEQLGYNENRINFYDEGELLKLDRLLRISNVTIEVLDNKEKKHVKDNLKSDENKLLILFKEPY